MDMKYRRPRLSSEQNERGRRTDQEEVRVINQESHLKVICDAKGRWGARVPAITLPRFHLCSQSIKAPHPHLRSQDGTKRPVASETCLAHGWAQNINAASSCSNHLIESARENLKYASFILCDLLSVKVISLCDSHVDEAKRWISLCNYSNPFTLNGYESTGST